MVKKSKGKYYVLPKEKGWVIKKGSRRAPSVSSHKTQKEAIHQARRYAKRESGEVYIHGKAGRLRRRDSYEFHGRGREYRIHAASDPLPPPPKSGGKKGVGRSKGAKMGKNQHVVKSGKSWAVKGEGNQRYTSLHDTQREAINAAKDIAKKQKSELFIHGRDGKIRERNSYGHDPYPPKG